MTDDITTTPDPVPERARIEPLPLRKRLDALPVLYLVGLLILSAALIYLWKHPAMPQGVELEAAHVDTMRQQLEGVSAQVAALQARPVATPVDLGPLEARVAGLEHRPAPVPAAPPNLAPLEARITKLEDRPAASAVDLRPLEARIAALEARTPVDLKPLEARIAGIEGRAPVDLGPLEQRVAGLAKKEGDDMAALAKKQADDASAMLAADAAAKKQADGAAAQVAALGGRLNQVEAQGKQTAAGMEAISQRAQQAGRLQAMSAALAAGQRLGDVPGAPPALARFAHDAPPTEAGLRLSFDNAAAAAHRASQPALSDNQPLLERMWVRAQQAVTVRQGETVIVGDPIAGVIEHARQALDAGDLAGAVKTLDGLAGPAKAAMADWVGQARSLLDARAAIGEMAARG